MEFRPVTLKNLDDVIALKVLPEQEDQVADNLYTIAQVGLATDSYCRAVYLDGTPVGFFAVRKKHGPRGRYIWRYMVDAKHQRKGIGLQIMRTLLADLFSDPAVEQVDLTVIRKEGGAEPFYLKCGFVPTGENIKGEWRMVLTRAQYFQNGDGKEAGRAGTN